MGAAMYSALPKMKKSENIFDFFIRFFTNFSKHKYSKNPHFFLDKIQE